jgi:hypothetical protein
MHEHQAATTVSDPAQVFEGGAPVRLTEVDDLLLTLLAKRLARALMLDEERGGEPLNISDAG